MADLPFERLSATRFSEQIANRIESLILGNLLRPGEKLPSERELATRFGVSRSVVRESIKLLEERGLVEPRNGRGAFVMVPSLDNLTSSLNVAYRMRECTIDQLHEARWCLESFSARLAAERATEEDIARMEAAVEVMDANHDNPEKFISADVQFHSAVASATQNPLFLVMSGPLVEMIQRVAHVGFSYGRVQERHRAHRLLLERIKSSDASGAEAAMRSHLDVSRRALGGVDPEVKT